MQWPHLEWFCPAVPCPECFSHISRIQQGCPQLRADQMLSPGYCNTGRFTGPENSVWQTRRPGCRGSAHARSPTPWLDSPWRLESGSCCFQGRSCQALTEGHSCRCWEVRHLVAVSGRVCACVHRREESGRWEQGAWAQLSVGTKAHQ